MVNTTIQDLCAQLIEHEDWIQVWAVTSSLPHRGFDSATHFVWTAHQPDLAVQLLEEGDTGYVLRGALSPDTTMIMWSSYIQARTYLEESVMDFLHFMRCDNLLRDAGEDLNDMETLILASIRPARFFEDVARFFKALGIPPMLMRKDHEALWMPLSRKHKKAISATSQTWKS